MIHLRHNIKYLRKQRKWSQEELGSHIGITKEAISTYERGKNQPNVETLTKLSELFSVTIDDLILRNIEEEGTSSAPVARAPRPDEMAVTALQEKVEMLEKQVSLYDALLRAKDPEWGRGAGK